MKKNNGIHQITANNNGHMLLSHNNNISIKIFQIFRLNSLTVNAKDSNNVYTLEIITIFSFFMLMVLCYYTKD